jgi:zinc and cadmium transporter
MSAPLLAAIYCVPIVLACLLGGWIPRAFRLTHTRMQLAVSFVAGLILGVGMLHLLPHGYAELQSVDKILRWAMVGFLGMFFVERFFHFHHHDVPDESDAPPASPHAHDHDHDHGPHEGHPHDAAHHLHAHQHGLHVQATTWVGTAFGMTLHSIIDGVALAAAVKLEWHGGQGAMLAGFGVFLAVLLHKPFDSLTISMLMTTARCSPRQRHIINVLYAIVVPIGVAAVFLATGPLGEAEHQVLGAMLGLAGGAFICIATSDLLPELQFHTHDRFKLSIALVLGVALAWGIIYFETTGHDHLPHPQAQPAGHLHHDHDHHDHDHDH